MNEFIKKNVLLVIIIIIIVILKCFDFYYRQNENSKMTVKVIGKVYDYHMDAGLDEYYMFKYFYSNKIYNEYEPENNKIDKSLIGRCFEVSVNPDHPSKSKLNLRKELDCSLYIPSSSKSQ
ncbi:hypothetical protein [Flavobacterium polysaccharolyticum]|uniref:Uncharacterized protein n=1 Tax=Flavobacterium polysaccharolyticum TaxID=3133148 RepID=A0ABU9NU02_9FLAO